MVELTKQTTMKIHFFFISLLVSAGIMPLATALPATQIHYTRGNSARQIPIENWNNLVVFNARVNGTQTGTFILDSGAGVSVIDSAFAASAGVDLSKKGVSAKTGQEFLFAGNISFDLPGVSISGLDLRAMDISQLSLFTGHRIDGVIGYELFSNMVVEVDYAGSHMSFYDPSTFRYQGHGEKLPVTFANNWPVVEVVFSQDNGKTLKGKVLIDTGSMTPVSLNSAGFCEQTIPNPISVGIMGTANGGCLGRIASVTLGNVQVKNVWAGLPLTNTIEESNPINEAVADAGIGLIGGPLLNRFTLIFDYSRGSIVFEPNKYLKWSFDPELLGAAILATGEDFQKFQVLTVAKGTPAESAGLKPGDEIIGVDQYSASQLKLWTLRQLFRKSGQTYSVNLRRNGEELKVPVTLNKLI
jgi:hypothetical protein